MTVEELDEPDVFLGQDTLLCYNDTLVLIAGTEGNYMEYTWSDGSSGNWLKVYQEGEYRVMARNPCGTSYDTIFVGYRNCEAIIHMPNAFSPNNDGLNDRFRASGDNITKFRMQIYDRWGRLLFESFNIDEGWDGRVDGRDCQGDVYIWSVYYESDSGEKPARDNFAGSLVLIR